MAETYRTGRAVVTPHPASAYPGHLVLAPCSTWEVRVICPQEGEPVTALGGERLYGYRTPDGGVADDVELRAGDRLTLVRGGLPFWLFEWRVERAP